MRPMRRSAQALSREDCHRVLNRCTHGVLCLSGEDFPYGVPLSYVWQGDRLFFHCARQGEKLDRIAGNPKVCFTVVDEDQVVPEKLTTQFRSVMVFGTCRVLKEPEEIRQALLALAQRYSGDFPELIEKEMSREMGNLCMLELIAEEISGKEAIEFVREKRREG